MSRTTKLIATVIATAALSFGSVAIASPLTVEASFKTVHCC